MIKLHLLKLVVILKFIAGINCSSVLESNGTAGKEIDATDLIALGREINEPFISLIGQVIKNYHICTEWSDWIECGAVKTNHYSTTTRTRNCGVDRHEETQINVCEGSFNRSCPKNYEETENGFCLKLYTEHKNRDEAESLCKNNGGFLINIDSDEKYADVKTILTTNDVQRSIHIDGRRKNSDSKWEYNYGSKSGYFHWFNDDYPRPSQSFLCLYQTGKRVNAGERFRTTNAECSYDTPFICEILIE